MKFNEKQEAGHMIVVMIHFYTLATKRISPGVEFGFEKSIIYFVPLYQ